MLSELIQGSIRQDRTAQQQLYSYTYQKLVAAVSIYANDNSERDWLFNLGMMRIYTNLKNLEKDSNYLGWARTLLVRSAIDHYRKHQKNKDKLTPLESTEYNISSKDFDEMMNNLETEVVIKILQKLPEKERLVFSMYEIDGYGHAEIQELTGINKNTSKWLLSKAKKSLKILVESSQHINRPGYGQ